MHSLCRKAGRTALILVVLGILLGAVSAGAAPEHKWRFGVPWPRPTQNEYFRIFCDLVKEYMLSASTS